MAPGSTPRYASSRASGTEVYAGVEDAICGVAHTSRRDEKLVFLKPAIATVDLMLVARANDDIDVRNWDEVRKLAPDNMVLSNRGTFATEFIDRLGGIPNDSLAATSKQNLKKLVAGRARFFLVRANWLLPLLQQSGLKEQVRVLPTVMARADLYIVLGRHVSVKTSDLVRNALIYLDQTGELDLIKKRWKETY